MKNKFLLLAFCFLAPLRAEESKPEPAAEKSAFELLSDQARIASPEHYAFAVEKKAQVLPMPDGRSFYLFWQPVPNAPMIVTLHPEGGWAYDDFFLWQAAAAKRGYGILAVQWWFGKGDQFSDYYTADALHPMFQTIFKDLGIVPGKTIFHGFGRGAAIAYDLGFLEVHTRKHLFGAFIANAGGVDPDFPLHRDITFGKYGFRVFEGTHWILYCGGKDSKPARDGCEAMNGTRQWLERFNGKVDLFIQDPDGDHGGFHGNPKNIDAAMDVCDRLLKVKPSAGKP